MVRAFSLALPLLAICWCAPAQPAPNSDLQFTARIRGGQTSFRVGEIIPLDLEFSSSIEGKYRLDVITFDGGARTNQDFFTVEPAAGWKDPMDLYLRTGGYQGSGASDIRPLTAAPITVPIDLNEWVRFDQPGEYRVTIRSRRASLQAPPRGALLVASNALTVTIVPATAEWQQQMLQGAVAAMQTVTGRTGGLRTLRFLGTEAAALELAHCAQELPCRLGLFGSPFRTAAVDELRKQLRDPMVGVDGALLDTMAALSIPDPSNIRPQDLNALSTRFRKELIAAIPDKQGAALPASIRTILNDPRNLSPEELQPLTDLLMINFDSLPVADQYEFLALRGSTIERDFLTILFGKLARREQEFTPQQVREAAEFNRYTGDALTQWYLMAPDPARSIVLREIQRPKPRFPLNVLGILPDKQLPDLEPEIVAHFEAADTERAAARNLALLISRYVGASQETKIVAKLDRDLAAGWCEVQAPLLAWLLRVDPEQARPRLEEARKPGSRCGVQLAEIGRLQASPIVEPLAIQALDSTDPNDTVDAIGYLSAAGSPAAEDALWTRFTAWSKRWTGHEAELNAAQRDLTIGQLLLQAIATGSGWLTTDVKLQRLISLAVGQQLRVQAQQYLSGWMSRPWLIRTVGPNQFQLVWYRLNSLDAVKDKLKQFPKGSEFRWLMQNFADDKANFRELAQFGSEIGLNIW